MAKTEDEKKRDEERASVVLTSAPDRAVDVFAGKESLLDKLRKIRKNKEAGRASGRDVEE